MLINETFKPGQLIVIQRYINDREGHEKLGPKEEYIVKKQYPHFVQVIDEAGITTSIMNADLMILGKVTQRMTRELRTRIIEDNKLRDKHAAGARHDGARKK